MCHFQSSTSVAEARRKDLLLVIALLPAQIPDVTETTETGDELLSVSSALGWVAIDGGAVIEFNAEQNGSLVSRYKFASMGLYNNYIYPGITRQRLHSFQVTVQSTISTNECDGATSTMSTSVGAIKWFGVSQNDSYGTVMCDMESSLDLCTGELSLTIDLTDIEVSNSVKCTWINY